MANIVVMGGGTGTYTVLRGLKRFKHNLSAIVSMMDSGGSNRVLRDELGLLPTSDIRQCLIALADESKNEILRNLFNFRFASGVGISGMTFGNLFMAALTQMYGSQEKAIKKTCELLEISGNIIPVTYNNSHLIARYENGKQVLGEHFIDEPLVVNGKIVELSTIPEAEISKDAKKAILSSDILILGPGDLFTSIIANLVVSGVKEAVAKSNTKIIYILNLMTKHGQTDNMSAKTHVEILAKYLGKSPNVVLVQKKFVLPNTLTERYSQESSDLVLNDLEENKNIKVVEGDFISETLYEKDKGDILKRSLVRHDPDKLAKEIIKQI